MHENPPKFVYTVNPRFCSKDLEAEVDGYWKFWVNVVSPMQYEY
jgi:hypothetical protein